MSDRSKKYSAQPEPVDFRGGHYALSGLFGTAKTAVQMYISINGGTVEDEVDASTAALIYQPGYPGYGETTEKFSAAKAHGVPTLTVVQLWLREGKLKEFSKLSPHERNELALAQLHGETELSDETEAALREHIRVNIAEFTARSIENEDIPAMERLTELYYRNDLGAMDTLIEKASALGKDKLTAFLLNCKNNSFSARDIETAEQERIEKELGFAERSEEEWRRLFRFEFTRDGVNVSAYLGSGDTAEIPDMICSRPVLSVGGSAVGHRTDIRRIILPSTVIELRAFAFSSCTGLTELIIQPGLKKVGRSAFQQCRSLHSIALPEGTETIAASAFWGCENLREVSIPASVKEIGQWAFFGCGRVKIKAPAGSYAEEYARLNDIEVSR